MQKHVIFGKKDQVCQLGRAKNFSRVTPGMCFMRVRILYDHWKYKEWNNYRVE